jgi:hypothetical protein
MLPRFSKFVGSLTDIFFALLPVHAPTLYVI